MSLRTPIKQARGLGSAKDGTAHFIAQRVSALLLIPLAIWLMCGLVGLVGADHAAATAWVAAPMNTVFLVVFLAAMFYHSELGVQVVVEDYVHTEGLKMLTLLLSKFVHILFGVAAILAVLRVSLGG